MRFVVWYRGDTVITADELLAMLPPTASLVDQQLPNLFLIDVELPAIQLMNLLQPDDDLWTVAPEQHANSLTRTTAGMCAACINSPHMHCNPCSCGCSGW